MNIRRFLISLLTFLSLGAQAQVKVAEMLASETAKFAFQFAIEGNALPQVISKVAKADVVATVMKAVHRQETAQGKLETLIAEVEKLSPGSGPALEAILARYLALQQKLAKNTDPQSASQQAIQSTFYDRSGRILSLNQLGQVADQNNMAAAKAGNALKGILAGVTKAAEKPLCQVQIGQLNGGDAGNLSQNIAVIEGALGSNFLGNQSCAENDEAIAKGVAILTEILADKISTNDSASEVSEKLVQAYMEFKGVDRAQAISNLRTIAKDCNIFSASVKIPNA